MITLVMLVIIICILIHHIFGKYHENYWKKRGVKIYTKNKVMGPMWEFLIKDRPMFQLYWDIYKQYPNEPAIGIPSLMVPTLYVIDPVNVRHILQKDFHSFNERSFIETNDGDLLAENLLFMHGARWKLVRQNMTPLFTAAKLKKMYYIMDKASQDFIEFLKKNPEKCKTRVDDSLNLFCNAALSAAVFGIETENSTFESPFIKVARESFASNLTLDFKFTLANLMPSVFKFFKVMLFTDFEPFFLGAVKTVLQRRREHKVRKYDFVDLCLSIQGKGVMRDPETGFELDPSDELLAAQGFFYFVAGVEPCATAIFSTLIELGKHPEIQKKVLNEIDTAYEQCSGNFTYDIVNEIEYLDKVLSEALRMYPPIGHLMRKCTKDTILPVGNIPVAAGAKVFIPVFEYHRDPKYFSDPDVFNPERFTELPNDMEYLPFGKGARGCIGTRYARLQVKAGLVHLLRNFSVKTHGEVKYRKGIVQVRLCNVEVELISRKIAEL